METKEYFLHLLSSYINNNTPSEESLVDWDEILYLSQIHSVQSIIYISINKLKNKPPIYDRLKELFYMSVSISTMQETIMRKVIETLTKNNINHVLFKGYVLRNYYPNKEARTFGDIDLLIDKKDRDKCDIVLKKIGFNFIEDEYLNEVWTYRKGAVTIEVHTEIMYENTFLDYDYRSYFNKKSQNSQRISKNTYELKKEDHFLYIIVHIAKHFHNTGVGIRMIIDIAVFLKKYENEMDMNYIFSELTILKLDKFSNIIFYICKKYFNTNIKCVALNINQEKDVLNYILNHGVFGFDNKDIYDIQFYREEDNKFAVIRKRLFPDYETMKKQKLWFKNGKKILLPYAWIRRLLEFLIKKEKRCEVLRKIKNLSIQGNDSKIHIEILKKVGLK